MTPSSLPCRLCLSKTVLHHASSAWLKAAFFILFSVSLAVVSNAQTLMPPNDNTSGPCLGVYSGSIGGASPTYTAMMRANSFDYWLNRSQTWLLSFGGDFSTWTTINTTSGAGITAAANWLSSRPNAQYCISVPMLPGYTDANGIGVRASDPSGGTVSLLRGANGNYDQEFVNMAQKLVNAGIADRTLVRLGWEFNGAWYPWAAYVDPVNFPIFFARIVTVMKSVNATNGATGPGAVGANLRFVWCGARVESSYAIASVYPADIPESTVTPVHPAYPGNTYVDYVGLDLYDCSVLYDSITVFPITQAQSNNAWTQSHNASSGNKNGIPYWKSVSVARGKPLCFPEWALSQTEASGRPDGGRDNQFFIQSMYNYIQNPANNVAFHIYYDVPSGGASNHSISTPPGENSTIHPIASKKFQELWGLPMPNQQLIGTVPATVAANGISVTGGGTGFLSGETTDNFYFTSRITPPAATGLTSDTFQVKIESAAVATAQTGIMVRQKNTANDDSAANGLYAALFLANGQCVFQSRTTTGAAAVQNAAVSLAAPTPATPVWLKLVRSGSNITGYSSANGLDWDYVGGQIVSFTGSTKIGVAVSSASSTATNLVVHDDLDDSNLTVKQDGVFLPVPADAIIQDNTDSTGITSTGTWSAKTNRPDYQGTDFRLAVSGNAGTYTFTPTLPAAGLYGVYVRWPADGTFSYSVPITVAYNGGSASFTANQEGGRYQWNYAGAFPFSTTGGSVTITSPSVDIGHVVADAVMFVALPAPVAYEAETVSGITASVGDVVSIFTEANASGGAGSKLASNAAADFIQYPLQNVPAGTYTIKVLYKRNTTRGIFQLSIDGVDFGTVVDEYGTGAYVEATVGTNKTLAAGTHNFRFTITAKNASSSGYDLTVDRITLEP